MTGRFRREAKEWLKADANNWTYLRDQGVVEELYKAGAVKVEASGLERYNHEADALFITLPEDKGKAIEVLLILAGQHGDEVKLAKGETGVVLIRWD